MSENGPEVYGEDVPLSELEWMELLYRMGDLMCHEHPRIIVEGGVPLPQTNRRIADVAFEIARRAMFADLEEG